MRGAEERIKSHLPKAMRSAVQFGDGEVTCDWDDRAGWRYEDTFGSMTIRSNGHEQDVTDDIAAKYLTERAFIDDILPFLDLRAHDDYNDAVEAGTNALADQTIRLIAADAAKRLGPHIIERTGGGATIITTTQGTVCMSPETANGDGSVQVTVDTPKHCIVIRIEPGGVLPSYVIWDLNNPGEENN